MQNNINNIGSLVISLDFEIYWGVRDKKTIEEYKENLLGVQTVIHKLLQLSKQYNIHLTFSTVGMLFNKNKNELLENTPAILPTYTDQKLSPYTDGFIIVKQNEKEDPFHFANALIQLIQKHPEHEIGTHTYSHYYCLEEGQTIEQYESDIKAAKNIANKCGINLQSIVFPRNQVNESYLKISKQMGILSYRGNPTAWVYKKGFGEIESRIKRIFRLLDSYANIFGHHCFQIATPNKDFPIDIKASMFLRPYNKKLAFLDFQKRKRIINAMTYAAKNNLIFHLWWHPHNFGKNISENFIFLEKIFQHYKMLNEEYGFQSNTMTQIAKKQIKIL